MMEDKTILFKIYIETNRQFFNLDILIMTNRDMKIVKKKEIMIY